MKTIIGNTSYRKQYALSCLIKSSRPNTRSFDNCFEMGDGDEVVKYVMGRALEQLPERPAFGTCMTIGGETWKLENKHRKQEKLIENLKRGGFWNGWMYFYQNGTYEGYKRA